MNKLQTMVNFVLTQEQEIPLIPNLPKVADMDRIFVQRIILYARFLKQSLELCMFVPCDENGKVLECPHNYGLLDLYPTGDKLMDLSFQDALKYKKAKERCLFKVSDEYLLNNIYDENGFFHTLDTVESLVSDYNNHFLELTETAIKNILI